MALGHRLGRARKARNMSQQDVADGVNKLLKLDSVVKQQTIQNIEARDSSSTKYEKEIATVLAVPYQWLKWDQGPDPFSGNTTSSVVEAQQASYGSGSLAGEQLVAITGFIKMDETGFFVEITETDKKQAVKVNLTAKNETALQIKGSNLPIPFRNGWHILISEGEPNIREALLLKLTNDTWVLGEFVFSDEDCIELLSITGTNRKTINRIDIAKYHPVTAFVPPSNRENIL